jgi:hypothetical protein
LGQWGSEIMLTELDQMTIANMTAALEVVCDKLPADKDTHENRKRIAGAMIGYARSGRRTLGDFRSLGGRQADAWSGCPARSGARNVHDTRDRRARCPLI